MCITALLLAPFLAIATGVYDAARQLRYWLGDVRSVYGENKILEPSIVELIEQIKGARGPLRVTTVLLIVLGIVVSVGSAGLNYSKRHVNAANSDPPRWGAWFVSLLTTQAVLIAAVFVAPGEGSAGLLLAIFVIFFCAIVTGIEFGRQLRIPLLMIFFVIALLWSRFDLSDNHQISMLPASADVTAGQSLPYGRPPLVEDMKSWMHQSDRAHLGRNTIILVSAEGGGAYAAYHAALVLAQLEDESPGISKRMYALSGVSGGSLGLSLFVALLYERETHHSCQNLKLADLVETFFSYDILSPLLAAMLGPDLIQRFLPFPIVAFDRARYLEAGFANAWDQMIEVTGCDWGNPFRYGILSLYVGDQSRTLPRLILNTTMVESGAHTAISYLNFDATYRVYSEEEGRLSVNTMGTLFVHKSKDFFTELSSMCRGAYDLSIAAAVSLSARFPFVTPAGRISCTEEYLDSERRIVRQTNTRRFVDGGYYDNSGSGTLLPILTSIVQLRDRREMNEPIPANVAHLHIRLMPDYLDLESGFNEVMSVVRGVLNARVARGNETLAMIAGLGQTLISASAGSSYKLYNVNLHGGRYSFPLGWRLSRATRGAIAASAGRPKDCTQKIRDEIERGQRIDGPQYNRCVQWLLLTSIGSSN